MYLLKLETKDNPGMQEIYINPESICLISRATVKDKDVFAIVLSSGVQLLVEEATFLKVKDFAEPVLEKLPTAFLDAWEPKEDDL